MSAASTLSVVDTARGQALRTTCISFETIWKNRETFFSLKFYGFFSSVFSRTSNAWWSLDYELRLFDRVSPHHETSSHTFFAWLRLHCALISHFIFHDFFSTSPWIFLNDTDERNCQTVRLRVIEEAPLSTSFRAAVRTSTFKSLGEHT